MMSDVGLFLLLFCALGLALLVIRALAWCTDVLEAGGPIAYFRDGAARYVTSSQRPNDAGTGTVPAGTNPVLADTYQLNTGTAPFGGTSTPNATLYRLSDLDTIAVLAVQRAADGSYRYSANAIAQLVGGQRAETLARIAELRPKPAPPPTSGHSLARPADGWQ